MDIPKRCRTLIKCLTPEGIPKERHTSGPKIFISISGSARAFWETKGGNRQTKHKRGEDGAQRYPLLYSRKGGGSKPKPTPTTIPTPPLSARIHVTPPMSSHVLKIWRNEEGFDFGGLWGLLGQRWGGGGGGG